MTDTGEKNAGISGHEFLELSRPIFSDPDGFRLWINEAFSDSEYTDHTKIGDGRNGINVNIPAGAMDHPEAFAENYLSEIPQPFRQELTNYLLVVTADVAGRGARAGYGGFRSTSGFVLAIRTEQSGSGFKRGHSHVGVGDSLTYSLAPIGRSTEIDIKGRENDRETDILESDYFGVSSPTSVSLLGRTWHRTPPSPANEKRLVVLVGFGG